MDNTEKLLRAFIDASGYDIEEVRATVHKDNMTSGDYKVTKRPQSPFPWMDTGSTAWTAIVRFCTDERDNIESKVDGYGDLQPVLDFFDRNCDGSPVWVEKGPIYKFGKPCKEVFD